LASGSGTAWRVYDQNRPTGKLAFTKSYNYSDFWLLPFSMAHKKSEHGSFEREHTKEQKSMDELGAELNRPCQTSDLPREAGGIRRTSVGAE